jgi:hypothetical protein
MNLEIVPTATAKGETERYIVLVNGFQWGPKGAHVDASGAADTTFASRAEALAAWRAEHNPTLDALRHHVTGKIERGEGEPIIGQPPMLECGHASAEFGRKPDGARLCYPCCLAADVALLADPETRTFTGYLSSDGKHITNWPGGVLMIVTRWKDTRQTIGRYRGPLRHVWTKTPDGRTWYGKGSGTGMIITLRQTKGGR